MRLVTVCTNTTEIICDGKSYWVSWAVRIGCFLLMREIVDNSTQVIWFKLRPLSHWFGYKGSVASEGE